MTPPASNHFNGKTFFQPGAHPERGFRDFLRWRFSSKPAPWPREVTLPPQTPPPLPRTNEIVATWLGHATFLVQSTPATVLFDPVFSERVSPFRFIGPRRVHPPPLALSALPPLDAVCISHDHYDHFDAATLTQLAEAFDPVFIAPLRHHELLTDLGARKIVELDWWQSYRIAQGVEVTLTPTKHWSNRLGTPRNHRLWGGFWMTLATSDAALAQHVTEHSSSSPSSLGENEPSALRPNQIQNRSSETENRHRSLWFVGDTGYDQPLFHQVRDRLGSPDLALVPIGAYEPRWFMAPMHVNPAEAVQLHRDVGSQQSIGMHWGTFRLTDEAREAPVHALAAARSAAGVLPEKFRVITPGESVVV